MAGDVTAPSLKLQARGLPITADDHRGDRIPVTFRGVVLRTGCALRDSRNAAPIVMSEIAYWKVMLWIAVAS